MKIKYKILGIISMSILFTGCSSVLQGNNNIEIEKSNLEKEQSSMETKIGMTSEQEALLCKISINEDRVKEGLLFVWQEEVLRQYDYAMAYLKSKYPSYRFHIVDCEPKNKLNNAYSKFAFYEEGDSENYYDLYLYVEDGEYAAEDDFYGYIIGATYENKLKEILKQQDIPCTKVATRLDTVQGELFHENMEVSDIINGNIEMQQLTSIYINEKNLQNKSCEEIFNEIKELISKQGIYGSYSVVVIEESNSEQTVFERDFNVFN